MGGAGAGCLRERTCPEAPRGHTLNVHEADGLRTWDGDGTVNLLASEAGEEAIVLLLERCVPGTTLATRPEPEQDIVVAKLLNRLWQRPPEGHPFRPLQLMCEEWAAEAEARMTRGESELDPGLVREGLALFRELPANAEETMLLCTDLHAENILSAEREPWLVIDPKPHVGDPTYDALQHMLNCEDRLCADPRGFAGRMARLLGLDPDRLLLWLFARCIQEVPERARLAESAPDRPYLAAPESLSRAVRVGGITRPISYEGPVQALSAGNPPLLLYGIGQNTIDCISVSADQAPTWRWTEGERGERWSKLCVLSTVKTHPRPTRPLP